MFDYHTHSLLSDGELLPAELIRRAAHLGYRAIGITDHVDSGNIEEVIDQLNRTCMDIGRHCDVLPVAGVELTHLPPAMISEVARRARQLGASLVIVHGETLAEPVVPGTNKAALSSEIDVLAHPGLITAEEVRLAAQRGVLLEISGRNQHCLANGHLVQLARELGAQNLLVIASDAHGSGDLFTEDTVQAVGLGAGLNPTELEQVLENGERLLRKVRHGRA